MLLDNDVPVIKRELFIGGLVSGPQLSFGQTMQADAGIEVRGSYG